MGAELAIALRKSWSQQSALSEKRKNTPYFVFSVPMLFTEAKGGPLGEGLRNGTTHSRGRNGSWNLC